jgi:hypothetical protein
VAGTWQLERGIGGVTRPARPNARALVCQKDAAASARRGRVWLQLATQTQHLNIDAAAENVLVLRVAGNRCSRLNGRPGASRNATSRANSPFVNGTSSPDGLRSS